MVPLAVKLIGVPLLHTHAVIGASRAPLIVELQTGGSNTGRIRITAGSVLLAVRTSFGLLTSAVFVRNVLLEVTRTGTVIVGNEAPIASASKRVQLNMVAPLAPIQDHPGPVGLPVNVTQAGSGSVTVVVDATSAPEPAFLTSIV